MTEIAENTFPPTSPSHQGRQKRSKDWIILSILIALSIVPLAAGIFRIIGFTTNVQITEDNARFFESPFPVIIHIVSASLFCILGAFQFAPNFRATRPKWHRLSGRSLVPLGISAALSGLWMTHFYPPASVEGPILFPIRIIVGWSMIICIIVGLIAILTRKTRLHQEMMIRGYAIGMGAGTQVLTNVPWLLIVGPPSGLVRDFLMLAGWLINIGIAEFVIRHERNKRNAI